MPLGSQSYVVSVTRGHAHDLTVIARALRAKAGYIGLMGSASKRTHIVTALAEQGFPEADIERIHTPIGLLDRRRDPGRAGDQHRGGDGPGAGRRSVTGRPPEAILLAAGLSVRMGTPKPLLPFDGVPAVLRAAQSFRDVGVEPVAVLGHEADRVAAVLDGHDLRHVFNPDYERGMYASVRAGVRGLSEDVPRFFVLPADCPLVRGETIGRLLRAGRSRDALVVYPRCDDRRGHRHSLLPT